MAVTSFTLFFVLSLNWRTVVLAQALNGYKYMLQSGMHYYDQIDRTIFVAVADSAFTHGVLLAIHWNRF